MRLCDYVTMLQGKHSLHLLSTNRYNRDVININVAQLGVKWYANKKAWMISEVFRSLVKNFDDDEKTDKKNSTAI